MTAPALRASLIGIVDDDYGVREAIGSLIRSAGFQSALFPSAEDFLASHEMNEAKCLILDVRMPRISGLELQKLLTEMAVQIPVIFETGYADDGAQKTALDRGAVAFLYKPFDEEDLLAAVRLALRR